MRDYLSGKTEPRASDILAIAKAAGVRPEWLLTGEAPEKPGAAARSAHGWDRAMMERAITNLTWEALHARPRAREVYGDFRPDRFARAALELYEQEMEAKAKGMEGVAPDVVINLASRIRDGA